MIRNSLILKSLILSVYFFTLQPIAAQERKTQIDFEFNIHDFGTIKEDGGPVSYEFKFTNIGNASLSIKNVSAACGCTVPHWPKEPIPPGSSGYIHVVFDPYGKPGPFSKTLTVFSNAVNDPVNIQVVGKVIPKPRKPSDEFPDKLGNMRMVSRYLHLGELKTNQWQRKAYEFYNDSDTALIIHAISVLGTHLSLKIEPMHVGPRSKGKITLDYSPKWKNDYGPVRDFIDLYTSDTKMPVKRLTVMAIITQSFDDLTPEQQEKAPKISMDKTTYDLGGVKQGETPMAEFKITNNGQSDLTIYKVRPSCSCTTVDWDKKTIKPGEQQLLKIKFDTKDKEGIQDKQIYLYTNDPNAHEVTLFLRARIVR